MASLVSFSQEVSAADLLQSKVGFTIRQDVIDKGVLPPEIPQNGQIIHYSSLPKTGSGDNLEMIIIGLATLVLCLVIYTSRRKKLEKGD